MRSIRMLTASASSKTTSILTRLLPSTKPLNLLRTRRILRRVEFHYTPKHGSWLNMAEIEIALFARGCLSRRVESMQVLRQRITALESERNAYHCTISWRFTSNDARVKLHDLYPNIKNNLD